jgi:hypothetical protein
VSRPSVVALLVVGLPAVTLGITQPTMAGATASTSTGCAAGAVVREDLYAPRSASAGQPFDVTLVIRNCTDAQQSITLEGKQKAPGSCFAPMIDPLALQLAPNQRYTMEENVPAQSCTGAFTVTWSVVQSNSEIAHRTRHIQIT